MKMKAVLSVLALVALSACFDIEQSLVLNKDMSGKAGFRMGIDFEPMVLVMLQMQRSMEGKQGVPTKEEIAKAKADFLAQSKKNEKTEETMDPKEVAKHLPEGITLVDQSIKQEGLKMMTNIVFGFTDPSKLALIDMPKKKEGDGQSPTDKNVIDKPFGGLDIVDQGKTVIIRTKPANPLKGVEEGAKEAGGAGGPENKEMDAMMRDAMKGLRVAFKIQAPFQVVETNATKRDGNTLLWEYNLESLEKMQKNGDVPGVYVKYKK
jgi:hypothetical protein